MIERAAMEALVSQKVIAEEICVVKVCSCCQGRPSTLLLVQCRGIAVVLEHICNTCLQELLKLIRDEKELITVGFVMK